MNTFFFSVLKPNKGNIFLWINAVILLVGIFLFRWPAEVVVLAYFFETIIIGLLHIVKMVWVLLYSRMQKIESQTKGGLSHAFMIPFFAAHYFFFIFVQSVFMFLFVLNNDPGKPDSMNVLEGYAYVLSKPNIIDAVLVIAIMNIGMTFRNFFLSEKYHDYIVPKLFIQPYLRIFIQQFVVILTGFFFFFFNGAIVAAVLLIILRLLLDLILYAAGTNAVMKELLVKALVKKQHGSTANEIREGVEAFLN